MAKKQNSNDKAILVPIEENKQEKQEEVVVYKNGITSIDFILPSDEREILEKNLNVYSDMEKMNNTLKVAQRNMQIKQKVKDLEMMDKYADLIDVTQKKEAEMLEIVLDPEFFARLAAKNPEAAFKALKSIGDFNKTNVEARENLAKRISGKSSNKKFKINLKFSNDSGEEYEFGVEG